MIRKSSLLATLLLIATIAPASAYVGPGAGISLLGALWGVLAAIAVAVGFILFWPIRRLFKRRKASTASRAARSAATSSDPAVRNS